MKIDIGGGAVPAEGHLNLDPVHGVGDFQRKIEHGIPVDDESCEAVRASHVLEHVLAGSDRLLVMNEVWRVLQRGGEFEIIVPVLRTEAGLVSWEAIADPTHISYWCKESFYYFTGALTAQADYGMSMWELVSYAEEGAIASCVLRKP